MPASGCGFGLRELDGVQFDDDLGVEIVADAEPEVFMRWAGKAVRTAMRAAPIRVDRVLERKPGGGRNVIDDPLRFDLVKRQRPVFTATWDRPPELEETVHPPGGGLPSELTHDTEHIEHVFDMSVVGASSR
jgi:hypothetical protein